MKSKKITIVVIAVLCIGLILSLLSATTYALFSSDAYGLNTNSYTTGFLSVIANSKSDTISLTDALPMTDEDGMQTMPYIFTIKNVGNLDYEFDVKLLSTGSAADTFSFDLIRLQVNDGEATSLSSLTDGKLNGGTPIKLKAGESIDISIRIWLSINTTNESLGKIFESKIVTDGKAVYTNTNYGVEAPIEDFTYAIGSFDYYGTMVDIPEGQVLLLMYNGTSSNLVIPSTYTIDGVEYISIILGYHPDFGSTFWENEYIETVHFEDGVLFADFVSEESLEFGSMSDLFTYCTNLVNVSGIPDSVVNMNYAFYGCTSLVNAPEIPDSVIYMNDTFSGCTSLVEPPAIPNSVTEMSGTFSSCTSLVNAPVIPNSVTYMYATFYGCVNLIGDVVIESSNVSEANLVFHDTVKDINVRVLGGTTTFNTFNGMTLPSNVTLQVDQVIPSINDFTYAIGSYDYSYGILNIPDGQVLLLNYDGSATDIVIPSTYTIDGEEYTPIVAGSFGYGDGVPTTFSYNENIESVHFEDGVLFAEYDVFDVNLTFNSLAYMFEGCKNLNGDIVIRSSNINKANRIFSGTKKQINVIVPADSMTFTTLEARWCGIESSCPLVLPSNVTLSTY